jgi:hypothetical protein
MRFIVGNTSILARRRRRRLAALNAGKTERVAVATLYPRSGQVASSPQRPPEVHHAADPDRDPREGSTAQ